MGVLSSNDWAVLKLIMLRRLDREDLNVAGPVVSQGAEDGITDTPDAKRNKLEQPLLHETDIESGSRIFSATWQSKRGVTGRWFFRASLRKAQDESIIFMLEYYNTECGVFRTLLAIPFDAWFDKMSGIADRISTLFRECRNSKDILGVKKALSL